MTISNLTKRFISYTKINTTTNQANGAAGIMPSSEGQMVLAEKLADELKSLGCENIVLRENCILSATMKSNTTKKLPTVGFFAHLDTSSEQTNDTNTKITFYEGGDIVLENGLVLSEADNPELKQYVNDNIIVTDGTSLLGADNKAGIAAIVSALEYFSENPDVIHGDVEVCFLPDEEQGLLGSKALNAKEFKSDFGYTLDSGGIGEIIVENWHAGNAVVTFHGQSAHPMNAKGRLVNSLLFAQEFMSLFPSDERPENTEGKEGYYWMKKCSGNTSQTVLHMDIRDFDLEHYKARMKFIATTVDAFKERHGASTIDLELSDRYQNVADNMCDNRPIMFALNAYETLGIKPHKIPMRGGYDGAILSAKGISCPNLFSGAHNFHSVFEYLPEKSLRAACDVVINIIRDIADKG